MCTNFCLQVGHVYKKKSAITFPGSDHKATVGCNNWRVAAVWMDQFYGLHSHIGGLGAETLFRFFNCTGNALFVSFPGYYRSYVSFFRNQLLSLFLFQRALG